MNRRKFLVGATATATAVSAATGSHAQAFLRPPQISVVDYGADPNGKQDSTKAIQNAIAALKAKRTRVLHFPHGTYRLNSVQRIAMEFPNMSDFEIDGDGSTLLIGQDARCMYFAKTSNVIVRDLAIDWDPLPFTQGTVTASGPSGFSLRVDTGFPVPAHATLLAIGSFDRSMKVLAKTPFLDLYPKASTAQATGPSDLRVELTQSNPIPVGTVLVLRFKGVHDVVGIDDSHGIAVRSVKVHSSYSAGFTISRSSDLTFDGLIIGMPIGGSRLLSTNADGMDFNSCFGTVVFKKCAFQGMGDDAINLSTEMWRLRRDAGGASVSMVKRSGGSVATSELSSPGARLEILDPSDLHSIGRAKAASTGSTVATAQMEEGVNSSTLDGAVVLDANLTPAAKILDCQFTGNRARAVVAHKDIEVRNCTFQNTTLAAILLAPDSFYMEGPTTRNVAIESNHFSGCHYGSKDPEGSITIDVQHSYSRRTGVPNGEAQDIRIIANSFDSCPTAAISCRSVDRLAIQNNRVGQTWTEGDSASAPRAMILTQLTNSIVTGNSATAPGVIAIGNSESTKVSDNSGFIIL